MSALRRLTARQALLGLFAALFCLVSSTQDFGVMAQADEDEAESAADLDNQAETPGSNNQPSGDESEDEDEVEPPPSDPEVEDPDDKDFDAMDAMTPDDAELENIEPESYDVQKAKAKLCLFAARAQATPQNELLKGALESYVKHSEGKLDEAKAQEMVMIHLFSRCWRKSKADTIMEITSKSVGPEEEPFSSFIAENGLDKPLNPMKEQLKKEEWDVVHEVLEEERKLSDNPAKQTKSQKKSQQKRQYRQANSDIFGAPGMNMSTMSKYMYTLVVLAVFFGICMLALKQLSKLDSLAKPVEKVVNEKKQAKKAAKEAAKFARKNLA